MGITSYYQGLSGTQPTDAPSVSTGSGITSYYKNLKPSSTPVSTPVKIAPNATNISQKPNLFDTAINAVKKIGKDLQLSFTAPKLPPKMPDKAFETQKPTTPTPIKIQPNQKRLTPEQLGNMGITPTQKDTQVQSATLTPKAKQIATTKFKETPGIFVKKVVDKIANEQIVVKGNRLGTVGQNINDIGAILSMNSMPDDYERYNKLDGWSKLSEATKVFGAILPMSSMKIPSAIEGAKDVTSFVRGLIGGYGVGSLLNFASQEPKKRSIGEAIKPNMDNMLFAYFTGSIGLPNPFEFLKKQPTISKSQYIEARDYLKDLGVKEEVFSNPEALKKAYFDLAMKNHPDKGGNTQTMARINDSFKVVTETFYDVAKTGDKQNIAGLLGDGEHTPQEVVGTVIKNNLEKTPEGKALIKVASEAQKQGQNITISKIEPPVEGGYLYHGTNEQVLDSISKEGLKPSMRGTISLSKDEAYSRSFAESSRFPKKEGQGVVLRVNKDLIKNKTLSSNSKVPSDQLNELLTKETIPPESLEIYKNGKWQPLKLPPVEGGVKEGEATPTTNMVLPKEASVYEESKKVGAKRISPDRVAHQQLTPEEGIKALVDKQKQKTQSNANSWIKASEKIDNLISKYGDTLPQRTEKNIQKYPNLIDDYRLYVDYKKYSIGARNLQNMKNQFLQRGKILTTKYTPDIEAKMFESAKKDYIDLIKKDISKGYKFPDIVLNYDKSFKTAIDNRARYEKGLFTSFSAEDQRIVFDEKNRIVAGMKRQDGKELLPQQKQEIIDGVLQTQKALGIDLNKLSTDERWVYVHLNGKNPFLTQNAAGLYRKGDGYISVSLGGTEGFDSIVNGEKIRQKVNTTIAHEIGHALDHHTKGNLISNDIFYKLRNSYKPTISYGRGDKYWRSKSEVTARALEEYVAIKEGHNAKFNHEGYWDENIFNSIVKPEIEKSISANFSQYKYTPPLSPTVEKVSRGEVAVEPKEVTKPVPQPKIEKTNEFQSRVFERIKAEHPDLLQGELTIEKTNLKNDLNKATELIMTDKQKAFNLAMNRESASEVLSTSANIALAEKALDEGNTELYAKLITNRSLAQTRRGKEISAERGSVNDNSTSRYVKELIASRLDNVGKRYLSDLREGKVSDKEHATKVIDRKVAKLESDIKNKKLSVKDALKLLDELTCIV